MIYGSPCELLRCGLGDERLEPSLEYGFVGDRYAS